MGSHIRRATLALAAALCLGMPSAPAALAANDGQDLQVSPECWWQDGTPTGGQPVWTVAVTLVAVADNPGNGIETPPSNTLRWSVAGDTFVIDQPPPKDFPEGENSGRAVVTVTPESGTQLEPSNVLTWVLGKQNNPKEHAMKLSAFVTRCADTPLPASGSSALAIVAITVAIPVLIGAALLGAERLRKSRAVS